MNYKSCDNCTFRAGEAYCAYYPHWTEMCWRQINCPHCGGILSGIREHKNRKYRHCYSCHFEFEERSDPS